MNVVPGALPLPPRRRWVARVAAGVLVATIGSGCQRQRAGARGSVLASGSVVLALGDSLTYGTGAAPEAAWPVQLEAMTGWSMVNGGVPGDTAERALERLPALLTEHRPVGVIVGIGGNDFLRRLPTDNTRLAIRRTVERAREAGAQVLLVAVPELTTGAALGLSLSDHPMYRQLADELSLPLHEKGWSRVLGDAALRSDAIHANERGYRLFAEGLASTLRTAGWLR